MAQWHFGALVGECGRIDFAGVDVDGNAVDYGPVDVAAKDCVQFANACLRQIDFERVLVEGFCNENCTN